MPLFSYFAVMGAALTLGLLIVSSRIEPQGLPFATSQIAGLPKQSRPKPEPELLAPPRITATNFAAPYRPVAEAFARATVEPRRERATEAPRKHVPDEHGRPAWRRVADNPIAAMMGVH
jgi:hypothetical protein